MDMHRAQQLYRECRRQHEEAVAEKMSAWAAAFGKRLVSLGLLIERIRARGGRPETGSDPYEE